MSELPLSLSLGASLPEKQARAAEALRRSEQLVKAHALEPISRIERERDAGKAILKAAPGARTTEATLAAVAKNCTAGSRGESLRESGVCSGKAATV